MQLRLRIHLVGPFVTFLSRGKEHRACACTTPQALLVVEAGSVRRTVAAEMRLAATALHGLLGAPTAAAASYAVLECKHIQHDTLSGAHAALCWSAC